MVKILTLFFRFSPLKLTLPNYQSMSLLLCLKFNMFMKGRIFFLIYLFKLKTELLK